MDGRSKSRIEMLFCARMPLQLVSRTSSAASTAARNHFQFHGIDGTVEAVQGMATMIWRRFTFTLISTARLAICSTAILAAATCLGADNNTFAADAERAFQDAEKIADTRPVAVTALVQLARAAFDAAEFTRDDDEREKFATRGIEAARLAIDREPTNAAAHYWLGMDLGQLARTKTLGALKLVREMEREFQRASGIRCPLRLRRTGSFPRLSLSRRAGMADEHREQKESARTFGTSCETAPRVSRQSARTRGVI